ncbi:unnamed protein product [Mucor hiemalis]
MTILNDSHLAYLLSLGFDINLCKQALTQNSSLESATDWILNPSRPPTLNLGIDLSKPYSSSSQLTSPLPSQHDPVKEKEIEESKLQQKKNFERIANELRKDKLMEKEARKRALSDIKQDKEKWKASGVGSSDHTSAESTNTRNQQMTERQRVQLAIKKEKQLDKEQRQRILQNIRNDQKDKKAKLTTVAVAEPKNVSDRSSSSDALNVAFIQFKLSNGSTLREKFPASTLISELFTYVLSKECEISQDVTVDNVSLVCGFPRRTYTATDGELNVKEAGFLPNVSLNVAAIKPIVIAPMEGVETEQAGEGTADAERIMNTNEDEANEVPNASGPMTGEGHQLNDPPPLEGDNETNDNETEIVDTRARMLSAIEQRNTPASITTNNKMNRVSKKRYTKSLKSTCSVAVAGLLSQHTIIANQHLRKLLFVSADVAEFLVAQLVQSKQLNASTLRKLADHCYLQNIVLDSYSYCTDSLIEDLCKTNSSISVTKLSLRGCDVITDAAICALEGLKHLSYLDLNNCKVTDKGLKSLEKLHHLSHLNLSKTKITNTGIASLVADAKFKAELQVLILDGCTRVYSNDILIPIVNEFPNLVYLSYAYIIQNNNVKKEVTPNILTNKNVQLRHLDINHTSISDNELINTISRFKNLEELKLGGCDSITTRGLSFLPRELKSMRSIQFPNREHELDGVLLRYKDIPLESLDLSGFLNLTDEGAKSIASMKYLRHLSLDGTKVTDEGISLIKDLIELEKLSLDRTLVTDIGLAKLSDLSKLETLSLSRTGVSNEGLIVLGDFEQTSFARNLRTLNLSQCRLVSDKGVKYLSGMANLTNLNLDHTNVSKSCVKYLKDLEHLNPVRLQGIERGEEDDMIDT